MEERFSRVRSAKDIAISVVLLAAGIGLIVTPDSVPLNITGYTLGVAGLILFFVMKTSYRDSETGEVMKKTEKYFPASRSEEYIPYKYEPCSPVYSYDISKAEKLIK